ADVLVVPTFNRMIAGVPVNDVTGGAFMSPLLPAAGQLSPVVRDESAEETLVFPPLEEFRHHL
ncbi:metallophosphoesterase, partial [Halobacteriales archaeon QH_10_67_13]